MYSNNRPALNLNLKLKNEGTAALKILNIDGGCSCRKVDHANIPATVSSGGEAVFKVELQNKGGFENQIFQFHIQLNDKKITVAAPLFALPDHFVSPSTLTFNLIEHGINAPLEFTHREVFDEQKIPAECSVNTSPALKASKLNSVLGKVTRGERLAFRDTTYSLLVIDPSYGNHKESLRLQQGANNTAFEVPVLWTRSEFLESIPKRVLLKEDPMRIFLRCPDDKVEFTHILSHQIGVRAFV
ncbi:DUF1573 domain-containing protein [Singulisphaera acidiphila]|uniref:DUF1573 domain-containing protein n=1 Tax=Singulisphaera acidiphila (strain ATCC BAA-1392 / DSM 18658 / VKM B-2454 / MOB10) TaxID=886293 RepID=L0D7A1_SINAD|nr:DUF1573 domain-containing protein [Singulisphaera acidiphila]AGA24745.1 hypothetical protein Sinac_0299 [Singulisphaera acidiphila DSM 18658]